MGLGVGFVAGYAMMKAFSRGKQQSDDFMRH